jgi:predicted amidophosphoribosyltransferase
MTFKEFYARFLGVHKCGGCGCILPYERFYHAFCDECSLEWNAALTVGCQKCFNPAVECTCMPKALADSGALCLRKLFFYENERGGEAHIRLIYRLKRYKNRRLTAFVADQLLPFIKSELVLAGLDDNMDKVVISWCPRGRRARIRYGHDQSEEMAKCLSKKLGAAYLPLFAQKIGGKEQKELDKKERLKNATDHIVMNARDDIKGKFIVLYDDMVTTGATMTACVSHAMKAGATGVICCSLACSDKIYGHKTK